MDEGFWDDVPRWMSIELFVPVLLGTDESIGDLVELEEQSLDPGPRTRSAQDV